LYDVFSDVLVDLLSFTRRRLSNQTSTQLGGLSPFPFGHCATAT